MSESIQRGVVHGKIIELDAPLSLSDGQAVTVIVQSMAAQAPTMPEGLQRSAGGWADGGDELDAWLNDLMRPRGVLRQRLTPRCASV
jgi:hypothetical protein